KLLRQAGRRLAPRALTLTLFARLMLADNFVHGIGGGRYDQVLERLIERHLGLQAPRFAVTTATLHFPTAAGRERVCLPCLQQERRHLRRNRLPAKPRRCEAIQQAPRRPRGRHLLFPELHRRLAASQDDPRLSSWEKRWQQAVEHDRADQVLFDRELFYAIQPRDRLMNLIDRYHDLLA